jgi:hypothetical protein
MHARKCKPKHERAKKGIENEIALTYFPILPSGSILMHFLWVDLFVFSLFFRVIVLRGGVLHFLELPSRFRFHFSNVNVS